MVVIDSTILITILKKNKAQIENILKLKPNKIIYYSYLFFHSSKWHKNITLI